MDQTIQDRFLSKVRFDVSDCHIWKSTIKKNGYGSFWIDGAVRPAHRVAYELFKGPVPVGKMVCHTCDVRNCVNPDHLYLGTAKENVADMHDRERFWGRRKLSDMQVRVIRRLLEGTTMSQEQIAEPFGISQITVSRINLGKREYLSHQSMKG